MKGVGMLWHASLFLRLRPVGFFPSFSLLAFWFPLLFSCKIVLILFLYGIEYIHFKILFTQLTKL
jgi:hypothetical protein